MKSRALVMGSLAMILGVVFLLPMMPIGLWVIANHWTFPAPLPQEWGVGGIAQFLNEGGAASIANSLFIAIAVSLIAVPLSSLAASSLAGSKKGLSRLIEAVLLFPAVIPPFLLVMGLSPWMIRFGVPSQLGVVITLVVLALPYSTFIMRSAYVRYDQRWEDEARLLGTTRLGAIRRVRLRILTRPLATAAILAFLIGWTDYLVTLVIGGGQIITLPMLAASASSAPGNESVLGIIAIISIVLPLAGMTLIHRNGSNRKSKAVSK
jgi:putative spermidine/putrescine transport system permease protein